MLPVHAPAADALAGDATPSPRRLRPARVAGTVVLLSLALAVGTASPAGAVTPAQALSAIAPVYGPPSGVALYGPPSGVVAPVTTTPRLASRWFRARSPILRRVTTGTASRPTPATSPAASPSTSVDASPATTSAAPVTPAAAPSGVATTEAGAPAAVSRAGADTGVVPASNVGLFEDLQWLTGAPLEDRLNEYEALGVKRARFQLIWDNVQRTGPTQWDWAPYDNLVARLTAHHLEPLAVLGTTPAWARVGGCDVPTCGVGNTAAFGTFAGAAAKRFGSSISAYEIWNEPNSRIFWGPNVDPAQYAKALSAAYTAIKAAQPAATVVTGGVAPAETERDGAGLAWVAPREFLTAIYDNVGSSFDAVGWHPYSYPVLPGTAGGNAWYQMYGTTTSARSIMVAHGDSAKQIWATEFGAHTDPSGEGYLSEAGHATYLSTGLKLWSSYSWAGPMFMYMMQDTGTDRSNREDFFGLRRFDGSPKPAYAAVKQLLG